MEHDRQRKKVKTDLVILKDVGDRMVVSNPEVSNRDQKVRTRTQKGRKKKVEENKERENREPFPWRAKKERVSIGYWRASTLFGILQGLRGRKE